MPQYLFMLYDREDLWADASPEVWAAEMGRHRVFTEAVAAADGARVVEGNALRPQGAATTLRMPSPDAEPLLTDGPFLETREAMGGYYVIEARHLDQALQLARLCPVLAGGIEVRPVWDLTEG